MNASSDTPKRRGPRKAIITPAVIQRAQELVNEHRAATATLAQVTVDTAGMARVLVEVHPRLTVLSLLRADVLQLLAADILALEREAKRLGVALGEPEPAPLLDAIAAAAPPAGLVQVEPPLPPGLYRGTGEGQAPAPLPPLTPHGDGVETPAFLRRTGEAA